MLYTAAETLCARISLLTRAAWAPDLPAPLSRKTVRTLIDRGALSGLVLREGTSVPPATLERARALLTRTSEVYDLLKDYHARGYRTLLPEDRNWPAALFSLWQQMPLFLFYRGDLSLLDGRRVSVAGSRSILPQTGAMARRVGERMAREGLTMVCGGALGVDNAAQDGALRAGGRLILVPARPAQETMTRPLFQTALQEGRLLMLSDALPDEPFSPQRALGRNHIIYALGAAALVLAAREGKGGSWRGARACLSRGDTPVFVPAEGNADQAGCAALRDLGARTFMPDAEQTLCEQLFPESGTMRDAKNGAGM